MDDLVIYDHPKVCRKATSSSGPKFGKYVVLYVRDPEGRCFWVVQGSFHNAHTDVYSFSKKFLEADGIEVLRINGGGEWYLKFNPETGEEDCTVDYFSGTYGEADKELVNAIFDKRQTPFQYHEILEEDLERLFPGFRNPKEKEPRGSW
jgi:hypothetical protein